MAIPVKRVGDRMIPRFFDKDTQTHYELYWKCTNCGWAITVNKMKVGKSLCILCDSLTKRTRVNYLSEDILSVL